MRKSSAVRSQNGIHIQSTNGTQWYIPFLKGWRKASPKSDFIQFLSTNGIQRFFLTLIRIVYVMGQYNMALNVYVCIFLTIPASLLHRSHCAEWPPVGDW